MDISKDGALNDFWNIKPEVSVKVEGSTAYFTAELNYAEEEQKEQGRIMEEEYFIHEVIVSNSKGKLFYYHSDTMNENFSYDEEYDELTPIEEEEQKGKQWQ